jgi:hypothetical protein
MRKEAFLLLRITDIETSQGIYEVKGQINVFKLKNSVGFCLSLLGNMFGLIVRFLKLKGFKKWLKNMNRAII